MKKKWILVAILLLIVLINPNKIGNLSNILNKKSVELENIKKVNIDKNSNYVEYNKNLVYYDGNSLKCINGSGKEIFDVAFSQKNLKLDSNRFIDILDQDKNIVYSVDKDGKVVAKKSMNKNGLLYKSIDNDSYLYVYKKDNKNIVNIYDYEFKLVKSINEKGIVTDIGYSDKSIYVVSINTEDKLKSTINCYDYNGNLKNTKSIDNSVILDLIIYKNDIYIIEKDKISKVNNELKTVEEFKVKDIKHYSNIYKNSIYIIENDNKIKYIDKDIEDIKIYIENLKGIINTQDSFIIYSDNKIMDNKGIELKKFDEKIKKILFIPNNMLVVELESYIQIINLKS